MDNELFGRLKAIPIKIIVTGVLIYLLKIPVADNGLVLNILTYALEAIAVYGFVSFFGLFFKGGRIIGGIVTSVIVLIILMVYLHYAEEGLVRNIVIYGLCFGGFVLDVVALIAGIVSHKKAKAEAKREAEYEEAAYIQSMQQQAAQQMYQQAGNQNGYKADRDALQDVINLYYSGEDKAKQLFMEIAEIVEKKNLNPSEMQKLADEHDNNLNVASAITGRIREGNYNADDMKPFRDKLSQCYTDIEILIRKLNTYLTKIKD